jgi:hypothetical protein
MSVIRKDGTARVKLIQPGWGSSGWYSSDVLKRDGPGVFKAGLKSFVNHPTPAEEAQRPERDVRDLLGEFTTDAAWEEKGPAGPGLYADLKVFKPYQEALEELAPHIGMSIRALGKAKQGEVEGRKGPIIESITAARSVDAVVQAGAGGKVLDLMESFRQHRAGILISEAAANAAKEKIVTEAEALALREANAAALAEIARLKETIVLSAARELVSARLAESKLPEISRQRLAVSLVASPIVADGALDVDAYGQVIAEAIRVEGEYVAALTAGNPIKGLGTTSATPPATNLKETWKKLYLKQGHSVEEAERMAASAAG